MKLLMSFSDVDCKKLKCEINQFLLSSVCIDAYLLVFIFGLFHIVNLINYVITWSNYFSFSGGQGSLQLEEITHLVTTN